MNDDFHIRRVAPVAVKVDCVEGGSAEAREPVAEILPSLIVETLGPRDRFNAVVHRAIQFLRRGVPQVWLVDEEDQSVSVYRRGQHVEVLDGIDVLFDHVCQEHRLTVADYFGTTTEETRNSLA